MDGTRAAAILLVWILFVLKCVTVWGEMPQMDTAEITVQVDERDKAILPCMVQTITPENEDKYTVAWMSPDKRLLTIGMTRIVSNHRFSIFRPFPTVWNLQIATVRAEDAGTYMCQMNTEPKQKKIVKLLVYVKPKISASPTTKVIEGRELQMTCNVSGIPPPTLKWFKEGHLLPNYTDELFSIKPVSRTDAGEYTCEASNDDDDSVSKTISVIVYYAPTVSVRNDRIGQVPSKEAVLECLAIGNPPGSVDWYRRGTRLEPNWRYEIQKFAHEADKRTLSLQIRSVSNDDYGAYVCVAENLVGQDQVTLTLYDSTGIETDDSKDSQGHNKVASSGPCCGTIIQTFIVFAIYFIFSI